MGFVEDGEDGELARKVNVLCFAVEYLGFDWVLACDDCEAFVQKALPKWFPGVKV